MSGAIHPATHTAGALLTVHLPPVLDIHTVPPLRRQILYDIQPPHCTGFSLDGSQVTHLDGIGLGLIAELRAASDRLFHRPLVLTGLPSTIDHLVGLSLLEGEPHPPHHSSLLRAIATFGQSVALFFHQLQLLIAFAGSVVAATASLLRSPGQVRWREFPSLARSVGSDALFIISLLGFLIGAILAFQTAVPLDRFGAIQLIPTIVGIAILRELGPLIAAILVAGRTGAAFAAELGTMRVTEELSALRIMGIDPVVFLVVPRVLATVLMLPILCIYTDFLGVLGGYAVMATRGFSFVQYMESVRSQLELHDALGGLAKTLAFAALIAMAGCQCGIQTGAGPGAVGRSTTRAVVSSIVLIIVADVFFGFIFYALGV
jgi:phospholipid/cholesterol/gamma-HCH transport system permease protein